MTDPPDASFEPGTPPSAGRTRRFAALDFLALVVLLGALNFLLSRGDPGWMALNPTPWLLVPAVLGVRYGFMAGLLSGCLTAGLLLGTRSWALAGETFASHKFVYASLPLLGVIVGQFAETLRKRRLELEHNNAKLNDQNRALDCECQLLFLAKQDLQQRLGLFGADSASLDEDLQKLAQSDRAFAPTQLLSSLERIARVRSAALYELPANGKHDSAPLKRAATVGENTTFPETIRTSDHQIVREALETSTFLIQKSLLEPIPAREAGYLIAYPIMGRAKESSYVLVVQDLPFDDTTMVNFEVIKSTCDWLRFFVIAPIEGASRHRAVSEGEFVSAIETALTTHTEQAVPSTLVRVPFNVPQDAESDGAFSELLDTLPRTTILTSCVRNGERFLLFLLPAISDSAIADSLRSTVTSFAGKFGSGEGSDTRIHQTEPGESSAQLWGKLTGAA